MLVRGGDRGDVGVVARVSVIPSGSLAQKANRTKMKFTDWVNM